MTIAIAGGSGFVGHHLALRLASDGHEPEMPGGFRFTDLRCGAIHGD